MPSSPSYGGIVTLVPEKVCDNIAIMEDGTRIELSCHFTRSGPYIICGYFREDGIFECGRVLSVRIK